MYGAGCDNIEFGIYESRHSLTAIVCIVLRFVEIVSAVGEGVSLILIVFLLQLSKIVGLIFLGQFDCWMSSCRGCVGSFDFCLSCDACSLRWFIRGRVLVSVCRCCVLVSEVQPVITLRALFWVVYKV